MSALPAAQQLCSFGSSSLAAMVSISRCMNIIIQQMILSLGIWRGQINILRSAYSHILFAYFIIDINTLNINYSNVTQDHVGYSSRSLDTIGLASATFPFLCAARCF
eukprot:UN07053